MVKTLSTTGFLPSMSAILTARQRATLSQQWKLMAYSLNQYQTAHWTRLTLEQQLDINAYQNSLLCRAQDMEDGLTQPTFSNAELLLASVCELTQRAGNELPGMRSLSLALNIGAISVALASAVARSNTQGINNALRELSSLLNSD